LSKTFTLGEAQTVLPVVAALLKRAQAAEMRADMIEVEMQDLNHRIFLSGGMYINVATAARRRAERDKAMQEAKVTLAELEEIGVQVKDVEEGLLDFPCVIDGRTVLLCWKLGEKEIGYWHAPEDGDQERRPLDGRFGRQDRERLN